VAGDALFGDQLPTTNLPIGLVINPTAGKGKGAAAGEQALATLQALGYPVLNLSAVNAQKALAAAREAVTAGAIQALVVVGGDGVVHLGVNACAGTNVPLGIVAAGTGNDAALTLGLPLDNPALATQTAAQNLSKPRTIDLVAGKTERGEFHAFNTVSAGFDALVNRRSGAAQFFRHQIQRGHRWGRAQNRSHAVRGCQRPKLWWGNVHCPSRQNQRRCT
jgi:diacylglycerol kinase (ATP)